MRPSVRMSLVLAVLATGSAAPRTTVAQQGVAANDASTRDAHAADALLDRRVTVDIRGLSLARAIDVTTACARVPIQYREQVVNAFNKTVTLRLTATPLRVVLGRMLAGTTLGVVADGPSQLMIVDQRAGASVPQAQQATGEIRGQVLDSATGHGLSSASVKVQGTRLATVTNGNGQFILRGVPIGEQVVTVRLFGYRPVTQTIAVTDDARMMARISMAPAATVLSGVVTTATGTQRKLEVGNDITTLNVDSLRQVAPITSVTDLLESRVPGLTVLRSSGAPGDPARLRLRGPKSITGSNDPILIVDGVRVYAAQSDQRTANLAGSVVQSTSALPSNTNYAAPSPLDQIDPASIETIEVLKGPSASSLYGSDAANGVIVITTKKGRAGPTHWTAAAGHGLAYLPGTYPVQVVRWGHTSTSTAAVGGNPSQPCDIVACNVTDSVQHLQVLNFPRWSPFVHGANTDGSMTVTGGSGALTYALTGSGATQQGYLKLPAALAEVFRQFHGYDAPGWAKRPDRYATWGGSGQLTTQPTPVVQLTFQSSLFHSQQQRSSLEQQLPLLLSALDTLCGSGLATCGSQTLATRNAYERATSEQQMQTHTLSGAWAPWPWLPLTAVAGLNLNTGHDVTFLPRDVVPYVPNAGSSHDTLGHYGVAEKSATLKTVTVNTTIPSWRGHMVAALGFNLYSQSTTDVVAQTRVDSALPLGVSIPAILSAGATQAVSGTTTYGWFFEPRLNLSQQLYLTPGFRLDGGNANGGRASVSGLPAKLTFAALFPKVNLSWVALNREAGERPLFGALTLLRPRLAIGSAGVQPQPGDQLRLLAGTLDPSMGLTLSTLGNTQLKPERSTEMEGGFETALWQGRVSFDVTRARQLRHDAIISVPVAASVFAGRTIALNIGEVRNTSTELVASVRPLETAALSWTLGGTYSKNDNVVLQLDRQSLARVINSNGTGGIGTPTINGSRIAVGYPLFGRWAQPITSYSDDNHDGIIEPAEIRLGDTAVYLGRQDPAYTATFTSDLSLFRGRVGVHANLLRQGGYSQLNAGGKAAGTFLSIANEPAATFAQQAAYVAAACEGVIGAIGCQSTYYGLVQTVSSWAFQSLSVNYTVPPGIARRLRSQHMSIALQGSNLGLWTNYRGKDPNVNAYPNGNVTADLGQLARPRTWTLHLTMGN